MRAYICSRTCRYSSSPVSSLNPLTQLSYDCTDRKANPLVTLGIEFLGPTRSQLPCNTSCSGREYNLSLHSITSEFPIILLPLPGLDRELSVPFQWRDQRLLNDF